VLMLNFFETCWQSRPQNTVTSGKAC
jgi:hypothetical protein